MPGVLLSCPKQVSRFSCAKHLDTAQASEAARMETDKPLHIRDKCAPDMHSNGQAAHRTQAEHEWRCD
ncbi:hypothetical protein GQ54DRAFT_300731, partial [Martensiomyces pterosporus]